MIDGIGQCTAAMEAAQRKLETAAENLANSETDGFHQHLLRAQGQNGALGQPGTLRLTGRPLDLAIAGPGALRIAPQGAGRVELERAVGVRSASFRRDAEGHLVDAQGRVLLGASGPVRVDEGASIRADGALESGGRIAARVPLARGAELRSGFVEGSDVNSIGEMIEILDAQRSFETAQKSLTAIDTARQKSTNDVGQVH